ncbi:sensor domain-containing diguanylate cyclase [Luteimonas vadosa]|uniref:GGDEF domain-containing protein n=1 Tax=Luteimonas vadosa TaxID=1165507 RepID=A0ABP9E7N8_9GAMM
MAGERRLRLVAPGFRSLQKRLDFERSLTALSAALMRTEPDDLDSVVEDALATVGTFFQVDRAYLFEIDMQAGHASNTHEWVANGISAEAQNLQEVPVDTYPWLMAELRADRAMVMNDIADLPEEAVNEREEFRREGIRSIAVVPIWHGVDLAGFAGFDAVRRKVVWEEDYLLGLRLLAQVLGSALRSRSLARWLRHMAFHDALTGLPNRALLEDRLQAALLRARRYDSGLLLAMVDLDDFKLVNDRHGHAIGDAVLCQVARRLQQALRSTDTVARLGGDEFVLVVEDVSESIQVVADRLLSSFDPEFVIEGVRLRVSPSIGIVQVPPGLSDADALMRHADAAMYRAKAAGKHRWVCERA